MCLSRDIVVDFYKDRCKINRLLLGRIIHRVFRDQQMAIEAVNFIFYRFLKTTHDQKRNNHRCQAYPNNHNCDVMNGGCKSFFLIATDSFGYEIRKVQELMLTFSDIDSVQNRITCVHNQQYEDSKF